MENPPPAASLYTKIAKQLRAQIDGGAYPPSSALPSERELCIRFNCSRPTIRRALGLLVEEGLVTRAAGVGTRVSGPHPIRRVGTRSVSLLVHDSRDLIAGRLILGAERCAAERGYHLILCNTGNRSNAEARYIEDLWSQSKVDGFLIAPADSLEPPLALTRVLAEGAPVVLLDRFFDELHVDSVVSDNYQGGYLGTQHLLQLGHRHIGFLTRPNLYVTSAAHRVQGYKRALAEASVSYDSTLVFQGLLPSLSEGLVLRDPTSRASDYDRAAVREFLDRPGRPTALFACNDLIAIETLEACADLHLRVPEDISLVGFDDSGAATLLRPPLTTLRQNLVEMGQLGMSYLLDRIEGRRQTSERISLGVELVVRESTAAPATAC